MNCLIFILWSVIVVSGHAGHDHGVEKVFLDNEIVPDVLDFPPLHSMEVKYTKSGKEVNLGNQLTPTDVREQPEIKYNGNKDEYYTLIMTDPDAPSRINPVRREFRHWQVVNIPDADILKGEVLTSYVGAGPPKGTGLHRYIFLVYKQPGKINFEETFVSDKEVSSRPLFSARKFAKKYNLELVASNFFEAQYDDSVPALHKQLGIQPATKP